MRASCPRCGRGVVPEPDGSIFCVRCATPTWWDNVVSVLGGASAWGRGVLWTLGAVLVAFGTLAGWALFVTGLYEVARSVFFDPDDWYTHWWVKGVVIIPGLFLELAFVWGAAAVLRRLLGERGAAWLIPSWVTVVGLGPMLVLVFVGWLPDVLALF